MSKYVKEMMMDQLRSDLDGSRSLLILDLKDLDAMAEHGLRRDLRKKSIRLRVLEELAGPPCLHRHGDGWALEVSRGPSAIAWGGEGITELAKEISAQVKTLKKPEIKGGAVDGVVVGPEQVEDITKLPSREVLIGQVLSLLLGPARQALALLSSPAATLVGQLEALVKRQQGEGRRRSPTAPAERWLSRPARTPDPAFMPTFSCDVNSIDAELMTSLTPPAGAGPGFRRMITRRTSNSHVLLRKGLFSDVHRGSDCVRR